MAPGWVHTVSKDGTWMVEVEDEGVAGTFRTRVAAIAAGRQLAIARRTEHVVHREDGTIEDRYSHGGDR
jgi:Uncharacterized protein conserved in bacteria (DUF2188)